jgi:hypothetical protein
MHALRFQKMRSRRALRSLIGCFAAYVIALQVATSGFVVISCLAAGAMAPSEVCAEHGPVGGDASGQGGHPVCPCGPACVMSTCAAMLATPVDSTAFVRPTRAIAPPCFGFEPVSSRPTSKGPHCPRAPPPGALAA